MTEKPDAGPQSASELLGTVLGQPRRHYPGLSPLSGKVAGIAAEVACLERDSAELQCVRATLLLNFGKTRHNCYGFAVEDSGSTADLLLSVLAGLKGQLEEARACSTKS